MTLGGAGRGLGVMERVESRDMRCVKTLLFALGVLTAVLSPGAALGDDAFERALSLASEKRYSDAREVLDPLLQREPDNPRTRLLHGVLRAREGRVGDAIEVFEALRRDHPDMSEPYNNLAVLYAVEGRLDDARKTLIAALEREPDAVLYANLGDVYTKLAHRAYDRARELEAGGESGRQQEMHTAFAAPATRSMDTMSRPPAGEQGMTGAAPEQGEAATASPDAAPDAKDPPVTRPVAAAVQKPDAESGATREAMAESESVATGAGSTPAAFCAHAGGFRDRRAVAGAALWLQSYGAEVIEVRHEERRIAGSYRVYLPPLDNREQAVAKLREIRKRGVRDVAVIPDGDFANGISFGIYREADNMHRRVAALGKLGYSVRSHAEDLEVVKEYVIKARAGGMPTTLDVAWTAQFPGQAIRVVDCG